MKRNIGFFIFLLNWGLLNAQDHLADNLVQQFYQYQSDALQEKLFVHTDKSFYLAGETIWFKVYSVDASWHKPFAMSSISYIEVLNKDLKPVMDGKIALLNGSGNGSLTIPGFLNTGNYIFRAYTNWMKNFPPDFYFEQTIHIVNTLKTAAANPVAKLPATIQFFPEGGNSMTGLSGKIAFKAIDGYGRGIKCDGVIVNQQNDTITHFQSLYNGMGNFQLRPEKNNTYYAILRLNDSLIKQKLPDPGNNGFVMRVNGIEGDKLSITVRATPDFDNTHVYLFVQTRQIVKIVQANLIREGEANFLVEKKDLGDGISSITLFNQFRQPVCERLIFKRPREKLFIQAKTDQAVYSSRKPVNIDLTTMSTANLPLESNCSLSVFMIDSLQPVPDQSIGSWLFLSSDLKGKIESPEYYFSKTDKTSDEALDNLLLTQGWRRFKWNDVLEYKKPFFEFLPEIEGPVVNGKIINKETGSPVAGSVVYLSIPGADYAFSSATSDAQGIIRFGFRDIYKNNAIVVQPAFLKDSNYRIDITSSWSDKFNPLPFSILSLSNDQENLLLTRSISNQVENTYGMDKKRRYVLGIPDSTSFYVRPDKIFFLEDYTRFQTMEEVLREYVEDVRIRKDGEKFTFKVRNRLFGTYFEGDPLILLDGIPIGDASRIIDLDPLKIKKIEVVMHKYYIGSSVFEGIVNVKSYNGELGVTQIDPNALVVEYEGLQQQRAFYSPRYDSQEAEESHMPDFRNVLYWAPRISTGANGKSQLSFYTSDIKGKFAIVVQGISKEGMPGNSVAIFEVRDSE